MGAAEPLVPLVETGDLVSRVGGPRRSPENIFSYRGRHESCAVPGHVRRFPRPRSTNSRGQEVGIKSSRPVYTHHRRRHGAELERSSTLDVL